MRLESILRTGGDSESVKRTVDNIKSHIQFGENNHMSNSAAITLLPDYFPETLIQQAKVHLLKPGEYLFRVNKPVEEIFYLQSGEIKAVRYLVDGTEVIMLRARANEILGESTMAVDHYVCDGVALSDCKVSRIPMKVMKHELVTNPDFSFQFMLAIARTSRQQCSRYERLRLKNAADRVLHYLLCESNSDRTIHYPTHLYEWAHELGLQKETLYRTLASLEKDGKIKRTDRSVRLLE